MSRECLASWLMLLWLYLGYLFHRCYRSRTRKNENNERSSVLVQHKDFQIASQQARIFKASLTFSGKIVVALPVKLIFIWLFQCVSGVWKSLTTMPTSRWISLMPWLEFRANWFLAFCYACFGQAFFPMAATCPCEGVHSWPFSCKRLLPGDLSGSTESSIFWNNLDFLFQYSKSLSKVLFRISVQKQVRE